VDVPGDGGSHDTFLCIAAAACLLRYLKQPDFGRGSLCAVVSACAILSKYSAAYIVVLRLRQSFFSGGSSC